MVTPVVDILIFLAAAFILGLALGWIVWSLKSGNQDDSADGEESFWKMRYNQARLENAADQTKISGLEKEIEALKAG